MASTVMMESLRDLREKLFEGTRDNDVASAMALAALAAGVGALTPEAAARVAEVVIERWGYDGAPETAALSRPIVEALGHG